MTTQERLTAKRKIKVLWLANWQATQIADFLALPLELVQSLLQVYKR